LYGTSSFCVTKRRQANRERPAGSGAAGQAEGSSGNDRFLTKEQLRAATTEVANAIFRIRVPAIWGEGTTACASDSKKFAAWDQNLMTEWHARYRGPGVLIYWHVERKSTCIYSQPKNCSSSEVAAMITGVLRHCSDIQVERNYVDTHGQSEIGFAFCSLLGFQLLPRLKNIHAQKLYRPETGNPDAYPNLQHVLTRPIKWDLIRQQYGSVLRKVLLGQSGRYFKQNTCHDTLVVPQTVVVGTQHQKTT
jgi:TnpA family transposase